MAITLQNLSDSELIEVANQQTSVMRADITTAQPAPSAKPPAPQSRARRNHCRSENGCYH